MDATTTVGESTTSSSPTQTSNTPQTQNTKADDAAETPFVAEDTTPDPFADFESKLEGVAPDKVEGLLKRLLKKAPIKAKSGKDEFVVDDLEKVKRSVSMDKHFSRIGEQLRKEKEEVARSRELIQRFAEGDPEVTRQMLKAQPKVMAEVAAALREQYEQEEKFKGMPPEMRAMAEENERMRAQFDEIRQAQQQKQLEAQRLEEERLYQSTKSEMEQQMISVLEAGKIPRTLAPFAIRRLAPLIEQNQALDNPLNQEQLAQVLKEQIFEEQRAILSMDGEDLLSMVGEDVAKKIGKAFLARVRGTQPQAPAPKPRQPQQNPRISSVEDVLSDLRGKYDTSRW